MEYVVKFMSLDDTFKKVREEKFESIGKAAMAVEEYAKAGGFSNVKRADNDGEGIRFTAKTPGGRSGRNIAYLEFDGDFT